MERKVYLTNTDIEEAVSYYLGRLDEAAAGVKIELVDVREALGRVTAKPVFARVSAPNHNAAAMDGIMAVAERTFSASETNPVDLKPIEDFDYVNTGQLIRDPYDCVILVEDLQELEDGKVRITAAASPWQHIRPIGEDIILREMVLPENHRIRPVISVPF